MERSEETGLDSLDLGLKAGFDSFDFTVEPLQLRADPVFVVVAQGHIDIVTYPGTTVYELRFQGTRVRLGGAPTAAVLDAAQQ